MKQLTGALVAALILLAPIAARAQATTSLTVPLIKQEYPGNPPDIHTVYVPIRSVGNRRVGFPILLDTGSAGMTIECSLVLPKSLCSVDGIRIDRELELDGVTVTTQQIVSRYGTYDEYGHLAYAEVAFGDADRPVRTQRMPLLIRYKKVCRTTGEIVGGPLWPKGIFGVAPVLGQVDGLLVSPIDQVGLPDGLHRGFHLSPFGETWAICTNELGDCPTVDALHIGLDDNIRASFEMAPLRASPSRHYRPFVDSCLDWPGNRVCAPTLYDTGNATIAIAGRPPVGSGMTLPRGTEIVLTGPAASSWQFKARDTNEVEFSPHSDIHLIGVRYFETNSLLIDLETREIGFRIGR